MTDSDGVTSVTHSSTCMDVQQQLCSCFLYLFGCYILLLQRQHLLPELLTLPVEPLLAFTA